jgi:hypothetical protein
MEAKSDGSAGALKVFTNFADHFCWTMQGNGGACDQSLDGTNIYSADGLTRTRARRGTRSFQSVADGLGFEPKTALRLYSISSAAPSTGLGHPSSAGKVYRPTLPA